MLFTVLLEISSMLLLLILEFWSGNLGLWLPLTGAGIFYWSSLDHPWLGAAAAILVGGVTIGLYDRPMIFWISPIGCWLLGVIFTKWRDSSNLSTFIFPGMAVGALGIIPGVIWSWMLTDWSVLWGFRLLIGLVLWVTFSAGWVPLVIWLIDRTALRVGVEPFLNYFSNRK